MNDHDPPLISVVMPVYNAGEYVQRSVDSILSQTMRDYEFIILDDSSSDSSGSIIGGFSDPRIRYVQNERNIGVARTLNKGLSIARGRYIARMDADDFSQPDRFARQFTYLENHQDIDILGSWVWRFDEKKKFLLRFPTGSDTVNAYMLFGNPLAHPTVMMRREVLRKAALQYDPDCRAAQDFDLWSRCQECCSMDNIPAPLLGWRHNHSGVTSSRLSQSNAVSMKILAKMLEKLDVAVDGQRLKFHREVGNGSGVGTLEELGGVEEWLEYLLTVNQRKEVFVQQGLLRAAAFVWYRVCLNSSGIGLKVVHKYLRSPLRRWYRPGKEEVCYFLANAVLKLNRKPTGNVSSLQ